MPSYIAFLRAVNVGGRFVRMAELRAALEGAGLTDVATHIQSGNVRVTSARRSSEAVGEQLHEILSGWAGFDIPAIVRTPAGLRALLEEAEAVPHSGGRRYLALADGPIPAEAAQAFAEWPTVGERATALTAAVLAELDRDFHKSTLTNARIEKLTGRTTTWRDLKVIRAIDEKWGP